MDTGELSIGIYTGGREMRQEAKYCAGSDAKLQGASYEPSQSLHWRMGWLETWPEQNIRHTNLPDDWVLQGQAYRRFVLSPEYKAMLPGTS